MRRFFVGPLTALGALVLVLPVLELPGDLRTATARVLSLLLTAALGWLAFNLTRSITDAVDERYDLGAADNLRARQVHTRVRLLQRILAATILIITAAVILMAFPSIRQVGITLFASAGIAGIIAGFAARPVLSNLLAGVQLALTKTRSWPCPASASERVAASRRPLLAVRAPPSSETRSQR